MDEDVFLDKLITRPRPTDLNAANDALLQTLRPEDVVHQRDQLIRWWSVPGEWQHRFALQGRRKIPGWENKNGLKEAEESRRWMEMTFKEAELYWVSPEMTEVIIALAPTIPDSLPQPPVPDALVMFARSIPGTDATTGDTIFTSAFLWGTVNLARLGPCIASETYAWRDLVFMYNAMTEREQELFRQIYPSRLMPTGGSEWPLEAMTSEFNQLPDLPEAGTMALSMLEDRQLLSTFWALVSQRIVIETTERPYSRQVQRQAERHGHVLPEVRVIRLREPTGHGGAGGSGREYSHRWLVGSHWRNQWYPKKGVHAPKLIEAYTKGPADKPLKVRETVRALVR